MSDSGGRVVCGSGSGSGGGALRLPPGGGGGGAAGWSAGAVAARRKPPSASTAASTWRRDRRYKTAQGHAGFDGVEPAGILVALPFHAQRRMDDRSRFSREAAAMAA